MNRAAHDSAARKLECKHHYNDFRTAVERLDGGKTDPAGAPPTGRSREPASTAHRSGEGEQQQDDETHKVRPGKFHCKLTSVSLSIRSRLGSACRGLGPPQSGSSETGTGIPPPTESPLRAARGCNAPLSNFEHALSRVTCNASQPLHRRHGSFFASAPLQAGEGGGRGLRDFRGAGQRQPSEIFGPAGGTARFLSTHPYPPPAEPRPRWSTQLRMGLCNARTRAWIGMKRDRELITLQFGPAANAVGARYWNLQVTLRPAAAGSWTPWRMHCLELLNNGHLISSILIARIARAAGILGKKGLREWRSGRDECFVLHLGCNPGGGGMRHRRSRPPAFPLSPSMPMPCMPSQTSSATLRVGCRGSLCTAPG